jgi:hypothetical protein
MYIYASLLGIAAANNMTPVFSRGDHPLRYAFKRLVAIDNARIGRSQTEAEVKVHEISNCMYDRRFEVLHTLSARVIHIQQYLQSWRYFANIESTIRHQFTFRNSYVSRARNFLRKSAIKAGWEFYLLHVLKWLVHQRNNYMSRLIVNQQEIMPANLLLTAWLASHIFSNHRVLTGL